MAPAQDMTRNLLDGSRKRRPLAALGFSPGWGLPGYEPKCSGAWVISAGAQRWTVEGGSCVVRRLMNGWIA